MWKVEADRLEKLKVWKVMRCLYSSEYAEGGSSWKSGLAVNYTVNISEYEMDGTPQVWLSYSIGGEKIKYKIVLEATLCHMGGKRYWFKCPLLKEDEKTKCGRRVGVLYFEGKYFGCRHCLNLTYESKSEGPNLRWSPLINWWKAQDVQEKMKRYTWAGRDTPKMRQFRKFCRRAGMPDYPDAFLRAYSRNKNIRKPRVTSASRQQAAI